MSYLTYTYLTNDFTLPAYQVVLLYKYRWDIEKIFHQLKSKMHERKSWACSLAAKQSHAIFECLAQNLLLLLDHLPKIISETLIKDWYDRLNHSILANRSISPASNSRYLHAR